MKHPCFENFNAVKTKSKRIAFGIAEKHIDEKSNLLLKIIYYFVGSIINRQQFKKIGITFKNFPIFSTFPLKFSVISIYFGMYTRLNISKNIFIFWVKKSINF